MARGRRYPTTRGRDARVTFAGIMADTPYVSEFRRRTHRLPARAFSTPVDGGEIAKVRRPPHPDPRLTHNSNGRRSRRRPIHRLVDALVPLPSFAHNRSPNKDLASSPQSPMDAAGLEDPDPSLAHGHRVFFEREVPFELRAAEGVEEPQEVGSLEAIKVKVLAIGPKDAFTGLRVELTSESNLFFHYAHELDHAGYRDLQTGQRLMVDFGEYPTVVVRNLEHCIKEPHSHLAVFVMKKDGSARLDFVQNVEYKFVELLSLDFRASPEETVRESVVYRYNKIKSRMTHMQARLADLNALVKIKNPSLLLQIKKTELM